MRACVYVRTCLRMCMCARARAFLFAIFSFQANKYMHRKKQIFSNIFNINFFLLLSFFAPLSEPLYLSILSKQLQMHTLRRREEAKSYFLIF